MSCHFSLYETCQEINVIINRGWNVFIAFCFLCEEKFYTCTSQDDVILPF